MISNAITIQDNLLVGFAILYATQGAFMLTFSARSCVAWRSGTIRCQQMSASHCKSDTTYIVIEDVHAAIEDTVDDERRVADEMQFFKACP